jgi:hypothetical protein
VETDHNFFGLLLDLIREVTRETRDLIVKLASSTCHRVLSTHASTTNPYMYSIASTMNIASTTGSMSYTWFVHSIVLEGKAELTRISARLRKEKQNIIKCKKECEREKR